MEARQPGLLMKRKLSKHVSLHTGQLPFLETYLGVYFKCLHLKVSELTGEKLQPSDTASPWHVEGS